MSPKHEEFISYVLSFYGTGDDAIYPMGATREDVIFALGIRIAGRPAFPFDGDSTDREMVRDIMIKNDPVMEAALNAVYNVNRDKREG
jgi:hypothetical protein|tara:strand:+ start:276 stop:539 length:264 start_codon:yes stop_codon:yes gene_type:complete